MVGSCHNMGNCVKGWQAGRLRTTVLEHLLSRWEGEVRVTQFRSKALVVSGQKEP